MLEISKPIIVEGKYDRLKILSVAKATVISTDGFGIFKKSETARLIRKLASSCGIIVLTDSDGAGLVIRNYIKNIAAGADVTNVFVPKLPGKEKRKKAPSKEGLLGVEGMDASVIEAALAPFADGAHRVGSELTKADFYMLGLSGRPDSSAKRARLARLLDLPDNLSASALIEAINLTVSPAEFEAALKNAEDNRW